MKVTIGKAPLTAVRLQSGARFHVDKGAPVPGSADPKDVARLIAEDFLVEVDVADEVVAPSADDDVAGLPDEELVKKGQDKILDAVGDDADRAARILALETGEGGKNRAKLVKGLEECIEAAAADGSAKGTGGE